MEWRVTQDPVEVALACSRMRHIDDPMRDLQERWKLRLAIVERVCWLQSAGVL